MLSFLALSILMLPQFDPAEEEAASIAEKPEEIAEEQKPDQPDPEALFNGEHYNAFQQNLAYSYGRDLKNSGCDFRAWGGSLISSFLTRYGRFGYSIDFNLDLLKTKSRLFELEEKKISSRERSHMNEMGLYLSGHTFTSLIPQKLLFSASLGIGISSYLSSPYPSSEGFFVSPAGKGSLSLYYRLNHLFEFRLGAELVMRIPSSNEESYTGEDSQQFLVRPLLGASYLLW